MKNIHLSILALFILGNLSYAGGEFTEVTSYETEDENLAIKAYEEPPTPIYTEPKIKKIVKATPKKIASSNGFYTALGISGIRYDQACDCSVSSSLPSENNSLSKKNASAIMGRIGYDFNQYIGIEARVIKTIVSDAKIDHIGLFIKPMIPIGDVTNIYALIGVAKTSASGHAQEIEAESLALGGGFEFDLSTDSVKDVRYSRDFDGMGDQEKGVGLFIDYERLVAREDTPDLDSVSVGVTYDF
ncbi:MAG TPA: porin family protein [Campylobacterales bacterium]|nr:porin family protein [Campylobacterales bacterium]HIP41450.1 porin family protein [Campylobacterales bacterium]